MESIYSVLNLGRVGGDYKTQVEKVLAVSFRDSIKRDGKIYRDSHDNNLIIHYSDESRNTTVSIYRYIEETVWASEFAISRLRKTLDNELRKDGLMLH